MKDDHWLVLDAKGFCELFEIPYKGPGILVWLFM